MWGTFYILRDRAAAAIRDIANELEKTPLEQLNHDETLLKQLFASAKNFDNNQTYQLQTVTKLVQEIRQLTERRNLAAWLGQTHRFRSVFWTSYVVPDDKDSSRQVLRLFQSGLSLPNRDYYLEKNERMKVIRAAYQQYFSDAAALLPSLLSADDWAGAWRVEHALATASWTDVELRDIEKNYNPTSEQQLSEQSDFDWQAYFDALGAHPAEHLVVDQPSFLTACLDILATTPLDDIRSYLVWKTVNGSMNWLSDQTNQLAFSFYGKKLSGMAERQPLWKRTVLLADNLVVGEALGKAYAKRHFPESSKQAVLDLVEDIRRAYHSRIDRLSWMSDATKQRAHTKLDNIKVFVGYPSVWKDFRRLEFTDTNAIENILAAQRFETAYELEKIGQKPKDEEWEMNAQTVNAYHHPNRLEIVFPAAILQAPFFDPTVSRAANLGGIGAVIGHELTHGFDDQGSQFDEHGNTEPWQTDEERAAFNDLADRIVRQADAFETVPGVFLQGKLILGEAIADVGGLELALEALNAGDSDKTAVKELFTNFARCECGQATTERLVELAKTDPHPPSRFRVNCVVCHADSFYDAYDVTQHDALYLAPDARAQIW